MYYFLKVKINAKKNCENKVSKFEVRTGSVTLSHGIVLDLEAEGKSRNNDSVCI